MAVTTKVPGRIDRVGRSTRYREALNPGGASEVVFATTLSRIDSTDVSSTFNTHLVKESAPHVRVYNLNLSESAVSLEAVGV